MTHGMKRLARLHLAGAAVALVAACTGVTPPEPAAPTAEATAKATASSPPHPPGPVVVEVSTQRSEATKPFAFDAPAGADSGPPACRIDGLVVPANAKIYAAGAYGGKDADFQIDQSGHQATTIQVAVNAPDAPVVLLLGAYEPTVWSVGWTQGTRIVAVLVTGYHRQQVSGLHAGVPQLVSTYDNRGACGYAYVGGDGSAKLNPIARQVFGRAVDVAYAARDGRVVVGDALAPGTSLLTDAAASPVEEFRLKGVPPAGQAGIDAALRDGILRPATLADVDAWNAASQRVSGAADIPRIEGSGPTRPASVPYRSYVVLKAFAIPAGLYGAHAATFFVARGVPAPTGNPGHSQVRFIESGSCVGVTCGMR